MGKIIKSKTKKVKKNIAHTVTQNVSGIDPDNILYMDATIKVVKVYNQPIWHVYKNNNFEMSIYSADGSAPRLKSTEESVINNIGKSLNPKLRTILSTLYNIPIDINRKDNEVRLNFLYSKEKLMYIPITKIDDKQKDNILQNCGLYYYRSYHPINTCNYISVNENYMSAKDQIYYSIDGLLLMQSDDTNTCHLLSGKQHVLIIEGYLKGKYLKVPIIGELYDAARSYKTDTCKVIHDYIKQGKLSAEFLFDLIEKHIRSWIELSTLTVFKTGLTYYEKMGYMRVGYKSKEKDKTYYNLFNAF